MSIGHSDLLIIEEKLSGRFQSSLECERPTINRELEIVAAQPSHAGTTGTAIESIDFQELGLLSDQEFLERAYLALFHRAADPDGMDNYLSQMQAGIDRRAILARLRYSPEGERVATRVTGLGVYAIYHFTRAKVSGLIGQLKRRKP